MTKNVYIDFENVPNVKLHETTNTRIFLFIGANQKNLSMEFAKSIQPLGKTVEWIQISGNGKNALDFHIAYYLALHQQDDQTQHFIVSKDSGFDPLVEHACALGQKVKRVVTFEEIFKDTELTDDIESKYGKVKDILSKQQKAKRPKSRKTLESFVETVFQKKISQSDIASIVDNLFRNRFIEQKEKRISYLE